MRVTNSGDSTVFSYDVLGRDRIWQTPDGNTTFCYETNGPGRGKIKVASTPQAYYDYKYNSLGLLSRSCDSISQNEAMPFLYEYDSCGRVSKLTYPTGYFVTYEYDTRGFLWKIKDGLTNLVLWQCSSMNADGNIAESTMGSGMITVSKSFDNYGFLTQIKAEKNNGVLQWFGYSFDVSTGNLQWRSDSLRNLRELFGYDIHDRLIWSKGTGIDSLVLSYDDIGNILSKTDVGGYFYDEDKVHAVDSISPLAPSYGGVDQRISYNYLNLPKYIATDNDSLVFTYGMGTKRIKTVLYDSDNQVKRTIWYSDSYERIQEGGSDRSYHWIQSPEGPVALVLTGVNTPRQIYFLCKDHLGSITALIDTTGNIVEELSFDPWGRRRSPGTWAYIYPSSLISHRGYTTHEHLDEFGLIHMNGRLYDTQLGRFLNPDPIIQDPLNIQNYNLYSYCLNNPLKYVDPSGYEIDSWLKRLLRKVGSIFTKERTSETSTSESNGPTNDNTPNLGGGRIPGIPCPEVPVIASRNPSNYFPAGTSAGPPEPQRPSGQGGEQGTDKMGVDVNYGLGFGFRSPYGTAQVRFANAKVWSYSFFGLNTRKSGFLQDENVLVFSFQYGIPLFNAGGGLTLHTVSGIDLFGTMGVSKFSISNGLSIDATVGYHLHIIGAEGYMRTTDFNSFIQIVPNARQQFYESTGFIWHLR